jgi:Family of unknown function (DUF5675)
MKITVTRNNKTRDGIFGTLIIDTSLFKAYTCENLAKAILPGSYQMKIDLSPRFNRLMPHIIVPDRDALAGGDAGIRVHWGNIPANYEGCIGVGNGQEGDSIDNTVTTFNQFWNVIKDQPEGTMTITIVENYEA